MALRARFAAAFLGSVTHSLGIISGVAATNPPASAPKSFHWESSWKGWDGLHLEWRSKTLLGQLVPGVTNLERLNLTGRIDEALSGESLAPGTNVHGLYLGRSQMRAKIGAKLALDGAGYHPDNAFSGFDDHFEVRRARLYAKGDCLLVMPVSYQLEVGYIPDEFYIEESYLSWKDVGWLGELKVGQFKAPMSLDHITSSRDVVLMEMAAPVQALAPGVDAGLQASRPFFGKRMTWTAGVFLQGVGRDYGDDSENYARFITRATALPVYEPSPDHPASARLLHLGLSANVLYASSSEVRYRTRPESHLAPYVVDTGVIKADGALVAGAEAAWVAGPWTLQAEYLRSWVRQDTGAVPGLDGFYVSASWFLTGESRPYDPETGAFARVIPRRNFHPSDGGWGAWELAARYSLLDLNSEGVQGGRLSMLTTGVNWHLHSHVKWRFDYGFGRVADRQPAGGFHIFQSRIEVDF